MKVLYVNELGKIHAVRMQAGSRNGRHEVVRYSAQLFFGQYISSRFRTVKVYPQVDMDGPNERLWNGRNLHNDLNGHRHRVSREDAPERTKSHCQCCNWQGLSPVLMPLTGLAPASPYFGLRAMGQLSFPQ